MPQKLNFKHTNHFFRHACIVHKKLIEFLRNILNINESSEAKCIPELSVLSEGGGVISLEGERE